MHHWSRRTRSLLGAGAATLALAAVGSAGVVASPAVAAPATGQPRGGAHPQTAVGYRSEASTTLLHLTGISAPRPDAFRGLRLGTVATQVDTAANPRASAAAAYLSSAPWLAGAPQTTIVKKAGILKTAGQDSGTVVRRVDPVDLPTLSAGSGLLSASALWNRHAEQASYPQRLTASTAEFSRVVGYPVPGTAIFSLRRGATAVSRTDIVDVGRGLGVRSSAQPGLGTFTLFPNSRREVTLHFLSRPALSATAGSYRSSVRYVPPLVAISGPGGREYRMGSGRSRVEIPLVSFGTPFGWNAGHCSCDDAVLRISLGGYSQQVGQRSVRASATALRIQVVDSSRSVLDMDLGTMDVAAALRGVQQGAAPAAYRHDTVDGQMSPGPASQASAEEPSDSPSNAPSDQPSNGSATATSTDEASPAPTGAAVAPIESEAPLQGNLPQEDNQAQLPVTGASVGLIIAAGVGLVGLGWLTRRKFRRRT
jgi:LPXTG-motif cell wall-anchored protein